jgi:hypothetical protein
VRRDEEKRGDFLVRLPASHPVQNFRFPFGQGVAVCRGRRLTELESLSSRNQERSKQLE